MYMYTIPTPSYQPPFPLAVSETFTAWIRWVASPTLPYAGGHPLSPSLPPSLATPMPAHPPTGPSPPGATAICHVAAAHASATSPAQTPAASHWTGAGALGRRHLASRHATSRHALTMRGWWGRGGNVPPPVRVLCRLEWWSVWIVEAIMFLPRSAILPNNRPPPPPAFCQTEYAANAHPGTVTGEGLARLVPPKNNCCCKESRPNPLYSDQPLIITIVTIVTIVMIVMIPLCGRMVGVRVCRDGTALSAPNPPSVTPVTRWVICQVALQGAAPPCCYHPTASAARAQRQCSTE